MPSLDKLSFKQQYYSRVQNSLQSPMFPIALTRKSEQLTVPWEALPTSLPSLYPAMLAFHCHFLDSSLPWPFGVLSAQITLSSVTAYFTPPTLSGYPKCCVAKRPLKLNFIHYSQSQYFFMLQQHFSQIMIYIYICIYMYVFLFKPIFNNSSREGTLFLLPLHPNHLTVKCTQKLLNNYF